MITEWDVQEALAELALSTGQSRAEVHDLVLAGGQFDRTSAGGWASGIARAVKSLVASGQPQAASTPSGRSQSMSEMIEEYVQAFPPDRLELTDTGQRERSPAGVGAELARLANKYPKAGIDLQSCVANSLRDGDEPAALSREREYDEPPQVLAPMDAADVDAYLVRLSQGCNGGCIALASDESVSDLTGDLRGRVASGSQPSVRCPDCGAEDDEAEPGDPCSDCGGGPLQPESQYGHVADPRSEDQVLADTLAAYPQYLGEGKQGPDSSGNAVLSPLSAAAGRAAARPGHT